MCSYSSTLLDERALLISPDIIYRRVQYIAVQTSTLHNCPSAFPA